MTSCRQHLSAYQRRSMHTIEIMLGICIAVGIVFQAILERHSLPLPMRFAVAALALAPILASIALVARYLRGETDEYLRRLVVESMLWGLGLVLIADSLFCYVQPSSSLIPFGNLSLDIFVLTASFTLEWKLWRNR